MKSFISFLGAALLGTGVVMMSAQPVLAQKGGYQGGRGNFGWQPGGGYYWQSPSPNRGYYDRGYYDRGYYNRGYDNRGYDRGYYYDRWYYYPGYSFYYSPGYDNGYWDSNYVDTRTAKIEVRLPNPNGEVWFDGQKTRQTGMTRTFTSPPLEPGRSFNYQVSAAWHSQGQLMTEERTATVRAGSHVIVDFTKPAPGTP